VRFIRVGADWHAVKKMAIVVGRTWPGGNVWQLKD
jgi:hypothetical protein